MMLLLAGFLLLGAACSQEEEVKAPGSPTTTPDPVVTAQRPKRPQKADAATAVVPAEASATPISTPIP